MQTKVVSKSIDVFAVCGIFQNFFLDKMECDGIIHIQN